MTNVSQYPSREADQFNVRFTEGLRDQIKEAAKASGRSMNAEIVQRLEASFEPSRQLAPALADALESYIASEVSRRIKAIVEKLGETA